MKKLIIVLSIIAILVVCVGVVSTKPEKVELSYYDKTFKTYGGSIDVYNKIATLTDCEELQGRFDTAYNDTNPKGKDWRIGYMSIADYRMKEIGCYK